MLALTPLLAAALVTLAGVPLKGLSAGWLALVVLAASSAEVIGSYVPRNGLRPALGCYGPAVIGPALPNAVALFGLTKRLGDVSSCDVPAGPRAR